MLMPDKHITLAESILGLGAFVLQQLDRARTVDQLYYRVVRAREDKTLNAFHDFDSLLLALSFLYAVGAIRPESRGRLCRCDS
jgi:hypothetical protein